MRSSPDAGVRLRPSIPIVIALALLVAAPAASAHLSVQEVEGEDPQPLGNSTIETLVSGELSSATDSDAYIVPGAAGQVLRVALLVPAGQGEFSPAVFLFWRSIPDGELRRQGFRTDPAAAHETVVDEDTGQRYVKLFNFSAALPANATYGLVVESLENQSGRYALLIGEGAAPAPGPGAPALQAGYAVAAALIAIGIAALALVAWRLRPPKRSWKKRPFAWKK